MFTASKACSIGIKEDLSNKKDPQVYTDIPAMVQELNRNIHSNKQPDKSNV